MDFIFTLKWLLNS